ncbi:hypothetical protein SEVIR_3G340200v4 [Setaria viridis]|uniref:Uncharacterized protein n=2 Tax=Setaria TaxID=4554 RepID=A0A368QLE6_SETIT|nr:hypothetical protein SETIT_3G326200v2 [Setaria italica]TKW28613.1 hypothetical protein SEVIR_3G340200v2 [Setaria viridis]
MPASPPLAVLLLLATALLLAASAGPAAADKHGGGRMAIVIRAPGTRVAAAGSLDRSSKWHGRRLEDEVAPEFGGGGLLAALGAGQGQISYEALEKDRAACGDRCAGKGAPYTRPCTYREQCRG